MINLHQRRVNFHTMFCCLRDDRRGRGGDRPMWLEKYGPPTRYLIRVADCNQFYLNSNEIESISHNVLLEVDDFCHAGLTIASLWRTSAARLVAICHASKLLVTICLGELAGLEGLHEDSWRGKTY